MPRKVRSGKQSPAQEDESERDGKERSGRSVGARRVAAGVRNHRQCGASPSGICRGDNSQRTRRKRHSEGVAATLLHRLEGKSCRVAKVSAISTRGRPEGRLVASKSPDIERCLL
eukprot:ctg_1032.g236